MSARRAGVVAVATVVVTTLLAVLLVTWAASIGPGDVLRGDGPGRNTASPTDASTSDSGEGRADEKIVDPNRDLTGKGKVFAVLALILNLATVVVAGYLVYRGTRWAVRVRRERRRRHTRSARDAAVELDVLGHGAAVAREMLADAAAQRAALTEGDPRNAVVACWSRFEDQAASAGIERRPWETSAEYTLRVLDLVDADTSAVARLAALFREARFSEHPVTEQHRAEALEALDTIHRTLGRSLGVTA
ncbi:DUF4129 domain-containing protein [Nocardioides mangrovi]|uniref:DUF4129 domain-containing protein n=1 Tax=Nocardioides mangrovi TaxID=2874580 RepID=A0ABS7U8U4_9ACTN|nr:DUF4129 domain-containing protein [Nocardioides mangrovi]MBZ5737270.1 DUF4129 domain-containing protein [Nocardioides mangrovi]